MAKGIFELVIAAIIGIAVFVMNVRFNQNCGGYLKQAADANTVELATTRIGMALEYIEKEGLTSGYTSIIYKTEKENVGFWYENIKACKQELDSVSGKSQLEQTNVLMKVRESLLDDGKDGTELTVPTGISRYPNNLIWAIAIWFAIGMGIFGIYDIQKEL